MTHCLTLASNDASIFQLLHKEQTYRISVASFSDVNIAKFQSVSFANIWMIYLVMCSLVIRTHMVVVVWVEVVVVWVLYHQ